MSLEEQVKSFAVDPRTYILIATLVISVASYRRSSPDSQMERDQQAQMTVLTSRAIILWDQIQTITIVHYAAHKREIDAYMFPSMRENAKRLEESIDKAVGLGLFENVFEGYPDSLVLFTAFTQSLTHAFSNESNCLADWTTLHLRMGMIRLLESCKRYHSRSTARRPGITIPVFTLEEIEKSRSYLQEAADKAKGLLSK